MHKKPTREVSGPILWGVEEQVKKGTLLRPLRCIKELNPPARATPITKLIRNEEETVRYIICASDA
jgi:hypothetical protein